MSAALINKNYQYYHNVLRTDRPCIVKTTIMVFAFCFSRIILIKKNKNNMQED